MKGERYFTKEMSAPNGIGDRKKKHAEKAVIWLLSKMPHSVKEIADHYDLSPKLVKYFLNRHAAELTVVKGKPLRYKINSQKSNN